MVYACWRNNLWGEKELGDERTPESTEFYTNLTKQIRETLKNAEVRIACLSHFPDVIIGYSVMTKKHLHWVFVKPEYRKTGVATLLTKGFKTYDEPMTKIGKAILEKKNEEE
jgi:hypothetical protein